MNVSCTQFTQFLVDEQPKYDKLIIKTIRPSDGWVGHVSTGTFPNASGVSLYQDRFEVVFPDTTKTWTATAYTNCLGTPCDPSMNLIGWGSSRLQYSLEQQSWQTGLLCFDQLMHVTNAKDQWRQIIEDILTPATSAIQSNFLRKRALYWAGKKWVANANMSEFAFQWQLVGDQEVYLLTNQIPTSKLTPQMLQRRYNRLLAEGYFGKNPFKEMGNMPLVEIVSDMNTAWELDHLATSLVANNGAPTVAGNWRFTQWDAAAEYWRYGFSGQVGNYALRVDPFALRFNLVTVSSGVAGYPYKFQVVLPFVTASSGAGGSAGLKDNYNQAYENAQYRMSFVWHPKAMEVLVSEAKSINPQMPFMSRNFGGKWQFVMDNLGVGADGCVINNMRRNKGLFIADFKQAARPLYTEFSEAIFHKGEPACISTVDTCNPSPGYPVQSYSSENSAC
jgi:hypothetical protein